MEDHPFIEDALGDGIINYAGLARVIQSVIDQAMGKTVRQGTIVMALKRLAPQPIYRPVKRLRSALIEIGTISVRSHIMSLTYSNSDMFLRTQRQILSRMASEVDLLYSFSQGLHESTIVASQRLEALIKSTLARENLISDRKNLAAVTLLLPPNNTEVSGLYYYIFKKLAGQDIPIAEVVSTTNECTLVIAEHDVEKAFQMLRQLKGAMP